MKHALSFLSAALVSVALLTGCTSSKTDDYKCSTDFCDDEDLEKIVIQPELNDSIIIHSVKNWKTENGNYEVAINGVCAQDSVWDWIFCSYRNLRVKYRIVWLNEKNAEIPTSEKPQWQYVDLMSNSDFGAIYIAPNKNCKNFKFYIQKVTPEEWANYAEKSVPAAAMKKNSSSSTSSATTPAAAKPAVKPADKQATPEPVKAVLGSDAKKAPAQKNEGK